MVKSKGFDNRTRSLFRKHARLRGLKSLRYLIEPIQVGEKVDILLNSTIQNGRPHRRFNGSSGTVIEKRGQCYVLSVPVGNKEKTVISRPEHLRSSKQT
ncbi:MAG: 50S ribosomal protein L21e [Candidatus Heimdallarchaeota archaeon]|nr:50S ribosomal protein L21e [Candidatus Heimdallarchaeota archaeon]MDH5645151.1 50S ribosomal protein L21e [Candidatus Heimdallarchaeota archaeon]